MLPRRLAGEAIRRKTLQTGYGDRSDLSKSVGLIDLVGIAIVSSVSFSTFVLVPAACRDIAGPSTTIAALLAFIVMLIAGMHYCELAIRFPKSGSAYVASYAVFGEMFAFLIGWITLVDYAICIAYAGHEWSAHTQYLFNNSLRDHINETNLGEGFDYLAVLGILATATLVTCSMKIVGVIALVLGVIAALIVSSSLLVGFFYADSANWISVNFFSNGFLGVLQATGKLSTGFLAFEIYSSVAEECSCVTRAYPVLMPVGIFVTFLYTFLMSAVATLTTQYYDIVKHVPLPALFGKISVPASRYVLSVGTVCGLTGSLVILQLPAARVLHAMAEDHLMPTIFRRTLRRSGSPAVAVVAIDLVACLLCYLPISWFVDILRVTFPLRCLACIYTCILVRYSNLPPNQLLEGGAPRVHYEKLRRRDGKLYSYTYVDSNGSIASAVAATAFDSDYSLADSIDSACVVGNMKALTIDPPQPMEEEDPKSPPINNPISPAKAEPENTELTYGSTLNVQQAGHVCEFSPCSQNSDDFRAHAYDREIPDVPYYNAFGSTCGRSESCDTLPRGSLKEIYLWFGIFALLTTGLGGVVIFGQTALRHMHWWAVCTVAGLSVGVVGISIRISYLPLVVTTLPKHVPGLPATSLIGYFLLTFVILAAPLIAFATTLGILVPGATLYCAYGRRKSKERTYEQVAAVPDQFCKDQDAIVENPNTSTH